jgi:predicted ATPase/class 3 adenylate cyclase
LFTDIEGSTRLWDEHPDAMRPALARHDELLRSAIEAHGGYVFSASGDGVAAAFQRSADAVAAAVDAQLALSAETWPEEAALHVRMGLHTGEAEERDGNYFGAPLNRAARLMAAAHGGQVVVSDVTAGLLGQSFGIGLIDLGTHRLRGLVESTRVFGVKADGLDWVDLPLATLEATRGNLAHPVTEWFGPMVELNRRVAELGRHRLVTLTGPGGVGKTRLAVEIGSLVAGDFPDGVWMVELAPIADPDAVQAAVASTLGVLPREGTTTLGAIVDWLEGRRLLLIVDNCEHVLAPAAELISAVAGARGSVTVIATSREPLGVAGEQVVPIPSLAVPDSVELFCDRARLADASLEFSEADRERVTAICDRLDGIPLAIELAAARTRSMTPGDLLARLSDRFRVLRGSASADGERHRTLQATVSWSYQLLTSPERLLFDRLSVFAGGFDLAAAEAVCVDDGADPGDVLDMLGGLVDKSLVAVDRGGETARYRLLESLRQYGEERLDERGETAAVRARHLDHYVDVARAAYTLWASPRTVEATAIFNQEWDNVRVALGTALENLRLEAAEALLDATLQHAIFSVRPEQLDWAQRTIEAAEAIGRRRPRTFGDAAALAWFASDYERAGELATVGITASVDPHDPGALYCWTSLAMSKLMSGRLEATAALVHDIEATLAATEDEADAFWGAASLVGVAQVVDRDAVRQHIDRAQGAATSTGALPLLAQKVYFDGLALEFQEPPDLPGAAAAFRQAIELGRVAGAPLIIGFGLGSLVDVTTALGGDDADRACRDGISTAYETGSSTDLWVTARATAGHLLASENVEAATVIFGYIEANHPGALHMARVSWALDPVAFEVRSGAGYSSWKSKGAAMSRSELVGYILDQLGPA